MQQAKSKRITRQLILNGLAGLAVCILTWAVTFNNDFALGIYTPLFYGLLVILCFNLTSAVKWYFAIGNFIISLLAATYLLDLFVTRYPRWNLVSDENFPYAHYFVLHGVIWILAKCVIDVLYLMSFRAASLKVPAMEKVVYKLHE
jgi:hypothetical protein